MASTLWRPEDEAVTARRYRRSRKTARRGRRAAEIGGGVGGDVGIVVLRLGEEGAVPGLKRRGQPGEEEGQRDRGAVGLAGPVGGRAGGPDACAWAERCSEMAFAQAVTSYTSGSILTS